MLWFLGKTLWFKASKTRSALKMSFGAGVCCQPPEIVSGLTHRPGKSTWQPHHVLSHSTMTNKQNPGSGYEDEVVILSRQKQAELMVFFAGGKIYPFSQTPHCLDVVKRDLWIIICLHAQRENRMYCFIEM